MGILGIEYFPPNAKGRTNISPKTKGRNSRPRYRSKLYLTSLTGFFHIAAVALTPNANTRGLDVWVVSEKS